MSERRTYTVDSNPTEFAQTNPREDQLGGLRNGIAYAIGQLDMHVGYLSRDIKEQTQRIEKLADKSEQDLKDKFSELSADVKVQSSKIDDQKASIEKISEQISGLKGAFYTSKWFLAALFGLVVFVADHHAWVASILHL